MRIERTHASSTGDSNFLILSCVPIDNPDPSRFINALFELLSILGHYFNFSRKVYWFDFWDAW